MNRYNLKELKNEIRNTYKEKRKGISQDKKHIIPVFSFEARRLKKGEEAYVIYARSTPSGNTCVVGRYPNKEAALAEMQKIAKAIWNGPKFYEIK